jgi:hypothetical protein
MGRRLKVKRNGKATLAVAALMAGPVAVACSTGPTFDQWASTDGAAGRINLDEVQEAFKKSKSATEFEDRVNGIYEGDGIVLIRAKDGGGTKTVEGWEDLNANKGIDDSSDDLLFSIVENNNQNELRGHGANSYYRRGFSGTDFLFTYMILSSFGPRGYGYNTSPGRYNTMNRTRTNYRSSSRYRSQVSKNSTYFTKNRSQYTQTARNTSTARNSYLNSSKSSGSFKRSGTGVRSSWGSGSNRSSVSRGGFRGGGGGASVIGVPRPSER